MANPKTLNEALGGGEDAKLVIQKHGQGNMDGMNPEKLQDAHDKIEKTIGKFPKANQPHKGAILQDKVNTGVASAAEKVEARRLGTLPGSTVTKQSLEAIGSEVKAALTNEGMAA